MNQWNNLYQGQRDHFVQLYMVERGVSFRQMLRELGFA